MPIAEGDAQQVPVEALPIVRWRCVCGFELKDPIAPPEVPDAVAEHVRFDCPKVQRAAPPPKWPTAAEGMTLAQLESTAARFGAAVATIKEAQALLGVPAPAYAQAAQPVPIPPPAGPQPLPRPPSRLDPEQQADLEAFKQGAERARMLAQNREDPSNYPSNVAAAMKG